jgi:phosphoadenosine phosphosulfate reductase
MLDDFIRETLQGHTGRPCITCSFQAEDMVVLDALRKLCPDVAVLFLDTGYHFLETYQYRDRMTAQWELNLVNIQPALSRQAQEAAHGELYRTQPNQCCQIRKVAPLIGALENYEVWFTGLRREQSPARAGIELVEHHALPSGKRIVKTNPLAFWTSKEVWSYLRINEIEYLPLYDRGYTSVGCEPCTTVPVEISNPRSGRWGGVKLECGIHTFDTEARP